MHKKILLTVMAILLMAILTLPTFAWVYHNDPVDDGLYEKFGPRADRLLIKLYADDAGEFAALEAHDIDLTDWPISKTEYTTWSVPPYSDYINIVNYGPEFGLFILDMNSNTNRYKGNPPEEHPGDPEWDYTVSPIGYPNPMGVVGMRRAIAYLVNRDEYVADPSIGAGFGVPMYTTMPLAMAKYIYDVTEDLDIPWAYSYSRAAANATLDAWGFDTFDGEGYRIWNVTGETVSLHFYIRNDHPGRLMIGSKLLVELQAVGLKVEGNGFFGDSSFCSGPVMLSKDFHLYTGGWGLGVDPDHLILWSWDYYWHPGFCYNYGGHNDPDFNEAADGIMYANTQEEAVAYAYQAQLAQARSAIGVPLYCVSGNKAYHKTYVGNLAGEEDYYGKNWVGVKNMMGYGIDNGWTLMNMHPECPMLGEGAMTIRWGFKASEIKQFNPVYSQWLFDWNAMDPCFTSLLSRDPNDLGSFMPSVAKAWDVSTYMHPDPLIGECTKIRFTMRDDVYWSDGVKVTMDDVYFTYVELKQILEANGFPNPWWYSNVADILSFSILDPCNFEVLLGVKSYWALGWIGGNIILPEHVWRPIAETGDPEAAMPDPTLTGNGPWKFVSYGGVGTTVLHERNPYYFGSLPFDVEIKIDGTDPALEYRQRITPCTPPGDAWFVVTLHNQKKLEPGMVTANLVVDKFIYFTNKTAATKTLVKSATGITLEPCIPDVETVTLAEIATALGIELPSWPKCSYDIDVEVHITGPPEFCPTQPNPWICKWKNVTFDWWGTIPEDLNFDCTVDIFDIVIIGLAFGASPGDANWSPKADVTPDYIIDIFDIVKLALKFGW